MPPPVIFKKKKRTGLTSNAGDYLRAFPPVLSDVDASVDVSEVSNTRGEAIHEKNNRIRYNILIGLEIARDLISQG